MKCKWDGWLILAWVSTAIIVLGCAGIVWMAVAALFRAFWGG